MTSDYVVDVSETDFEYQVIAFSQNTPVVVEFWAAWSRASRELTPILERIAEDARGSFRLARLDVDASPNLAGFYSVRSVPAVKAFSGGAIVGEFSGLIPEFRIREFVSRITPPSPAQLALERSEGLMALHRFDQAEAEYLHLVEQGQEIPASLLGLARIHLWRGDGARVKSLLQRIPASPQYAQAERLLPLAEALIDLQENRLPARGELDAAFTQAVRLFQRGKPAPALDGLLDILRQDRKYAEGRARLVVLGILELMGEEDPLTREYRTELATILF